MLEPHLRRSNGHVFRLHRIDGAWHPRLDVAEGAGARADIAKDHHRGMFPGPALADIGAGGLFAHRIELEITRSEEHTSELQSLMRISYAVFCLKQKTKIKAHIHITNQFL